MDAIDEIIEKIKKAVRLANKTTSEGERDTAMRLARNLAKKNGIEFDDIAVEEQDARATSVADQEWIAKHGCVTGHVCSIIRHHFGVVVMMTNSRGRHGKVRLTWFGSSLNIDIAKHVHEILMRESMRTYRKAKTTFSDMGVKLNQTDFMAGFFYKIHLKLTEHPLRNDLDQFEAERKNAELEFDKYKQNNKVKEEKARQTKNKDATSIAEGVRAASGVALNRPCTCASDSGTQQLKEPAKLLK